jgi:hypothetical protein
VPKASRTYKQWRVDAVAVLLLVASVSFLALLIVPMARIAANPARAAGVVYAKKTIESDGESVPSYILRYSFRASAGLEYRGSAEVGVKVYDRTSIGDPMEIEYAADDPSANRMIGDPGFAASQLKGELMIVFFVGLFVYLGPRRWLHTWRGEPDPGPLT